MYNVNQCHNQQKYCNQSGLPLTGKNRTIKEHYFFDKLFHMCLMFL